MKCGKGIQRSIGNCSRWSCMIVRPSLTANAVEVLRRYQWRAVLLRNKLVLKSQKKETRLILKFVGINNKNPHRGGNTKEKWASTTSLPSETLFIDMPCPCLLSSWIIECSPYADYISPWLQAGSNVDCCSKARVVIKHSRASHRAGKGCNAARWNPAIISQESVYGGRRWTIKREEFKK